jgi:hypothetical protein
MIFERAAFFRTARERLRSRFFDLLRHVARIDDTREIMTGLLREQNVLPVSPSDPNWGDPPYPDIGWGSAERATSRRSDVVFITGRFRSGSTLLWNVFRNVENVTAYYEPFNERRWFDPATRGSRVDSTHLHVREYWSEYDGLATLGEHYSEEWTRRQLYMNANAWNPAMQRYIEMLVEAARGRPVLQFNRVDLRLPWLRARFPNAKILHVFRHPRDQWCSTLGRFTGDGRMLKLRDFEPLDGFYLASWGRDLRHTFPFLATDPDAHPYELFYQIWWLSYSFGRRYADLSIRFEDLVASPRPVIANALRALSMDLKQSDRLTSLVEPMQTGRWVTFGHRHWFEAVERRASRALLEHLAPLAQTAGRPAKRSTLLGPSEDPGAEATSLLGEVTA